MPLNHAILAFVQFRPMSGYDLKKYFDESITHFWSATQSHIYKALDMLLKEGWVEVEHIEQEGRPDRKVYRITPAGAEELYRWLATPRPMETIRKDWLIQLFFAHWLSNEEIVHLLEVRAAAIREFLETYQSQIQANIDHNYEQIGVERARDLWQMTLDYGIAAQEAELHWLDEAIERARMLPPLTSPKTDGLDE
jgi:PadR family transcriptional regulator AphA